MTITKQTIGGHYRIICSLGEGTFGRIYLAEDLHAKKRKVVVKQFSFFCNSQSTFNKAKELFEREAEVLYELSHTVQNQQIPRFIGFFEENKDFYLIEEYVEGETLRAKLAQKTRLTEDEIVDLLKDVLYILELIHEQGIIHRDIKPDNIIIRASDGKPTLIDFGAVKEIAQVVNLQSQSKPTVIYTPGYSPIEQINGEAQFNADIYALGMSALEAITGLEPEQLKDDTGKVIWWNQIQVSQGLVEILQKMVHQDYRSRYHSAEDVLIDLTKLEQAKNTLIFAPQKYSQVKTIHKSNLQPISTLPQWLKFAVLPLMVVLISALSTFLAVRKLLIPSEPKIDFYQQTQEETIPKADSQFSNLPNTSKKRENINPCPPILAPGQSCNK